MQWGTCPRDTWKMEGDFEGRESSEERDGDNNDENMINIHYLCVCSCNKQNPTKTDYKGMTWQGCQK